MNRGAGVCVRRRRRSAWRVALAAAGLVGLMGGVAGCDPAQSGGPQTKAQRVAMEHTEPNISDVMALYDGFRPWILSQDKSRVRGVHVSALYLIGPERYGVFGDGIIRPRLYVLERQANGTKVPRLIKQWSFTVEEAIPWRSKKQTLMGKGYGLPLDWEDIELGGKEIRVVIAFERVDGRIVTSAAKDLRVPPSAIPTPEPESTSS